MKSLIFHIACGLLLSLLLYTAVSKINDFENFKQVLHKSPLIGKKNILVANGVVLTEMVISVLLCVPVTQRIAMYAALGLLAVFTLYIGYMLLFAPYLPCACGGVISEMNWTQHVIFNLTFMLIACTGLRFEYLGRKKYLS